MISSRNKGWIGVDVGSHAVKLAQVERHGGQIRIVEALVVRRRDPWAGDDPDLPPQPSSEEIRAALSLGNNFVGRRAAAVLSMTACDARGCTVDDGSNLELSELMDKELHSVYGDEIRNRQFDFWSVHLPGDASPSNENVIAFSISDGWSQRVADDLRESRLVGETLDALPLAIGRAVELSSPGFSREPIAAVDWGGRRATLCVVKSGRPLFVRCLRESGFAAVVQALCKHLSVTADEAQKLLSDHGLPNHESPAEDELQNVIEEITAEALNAFAGELNRTLAFIRQQRRALAPTKILLFGGGAAVKNVTGCLSHKVDLPIDRWRMDMEGASRERERHSPIEMLGPAIALSALAWSKS